MKIYQICWDDSNKAKPIVVCLAEVVVLPDYETSKSLNWQELGNFATLLDAEQIIPKGENVYW